MSIAELINIKEQVEDIKLDRLHADEEFNSRGKIIPLDVVSLAKSISENSLLQPISVYPYNEEERKKYGKDYKIILGYRRYAAHEILNKETIACIIKPWMEESKARILNITENLKREDLNILQEAKSIEKLKYAGWTQEMVAKALDVSIGWVQIRFNVLSFPKDIQEECAKGTLNQMQIKQIYSLPLEKQYEAVRAIKDQRFKGEKNIKVKRAISANTKVVRTKGGINKMADFIYELLGPSLATRVAKWAAGEIATMDVMTDIRKEAEKEGKFFSIPQEEFL
jgi:ParB/RepB/Spo0J family partition protein